VLSTLVWMMLLISSILTYYSTLTPTHFQGPAILAFQVRVARWLSIFLRRFGKLTAGLNAVWIIATGLFQFSGFYNRCYCNSSVMGLGRHAYDIIFLVSVEMGPMSTAWIGGFFLAAGTSIIFAGFVTLLIDRPFLP
jgi:hypothetical protein